MLILKMCVIFGAGILADALVAKYTLAVADRKPLIAANFSGLLALVNLAVLGAVLAWAGDHGVIPVLAYAGGNWVGTYLTIRRTLRSSVEKSGEKRSRRNVSLHPERARLSTPDRASSSVSCFGTRQ